MLPNFFIVGTPKSGTTSLYHYLDEHPEVFMCSVKEPNFFSHDQIVKQQLYYAEKGIARKDDYKKLFHDVTAEKVIGEASVSYLFYEQVPLRIKAAVPNAKIILILRNPVDRGFSHYLMDLRLGYVDLTFEDIVYKQTDHHLLDLYYQQFVKLGFYYRQVARYLDVFGEKQIKIFINDDLKKDMTQVILDVYNFLEITPNFIPDLDKQYNIYQKPRNALIAYLYSFRNVRGIAQSIIPSGFVDTVKNSLLVPWKKPELSQKTKIYLNNLYKENILQTGNLIGRDLSYWCCEELNLYENRNH